MDYPYRQPNGQEEQLNRQVAGHLYYSLESGATLLNKLIEDIPISFSDETAIIATQDNPLPHTLETEKDREIDWVLEDQDKLVGVESKYDSLLDKSQLQDEISKLLVNANEKDVHLIVFTNDNENVTPSLLGAFETDPVYWISWKSVAKIIRQTEGEAVSAEQRVPLRMLQDLFEGENLIATADQQDGQWKEDFNTIKRKISQLEQGTRIRVISDTGTEKRNQLGTVEGTDPIKFTSRSATYTIRLNEEEQTASMHSPAVDRQILDIHRRDE